MTRTVEYPDLMEMVNSGGAPTTSKQLETYTRKEKTLSFLTGTGKVADIGCGWGLLSVYLSKKGNEVVGVDNDGSVIEHAMETNRRFGGSAHFIQGCAEHLDLKSETFDVVIWEEMLEHLSDISAAFREGYRILKRGGKAVLSVPNDKSLRERIIAMMGLSERFRWDQHKHYFDRDSIQKLFEQAGFRTLAVASDVVPFPCLPMGVLWRTRKKLAQRFVSLGHHIFIYGEKAL